MPRYTAKQKAALLRKQAKANKRFDAARKKIRHALREIETSEETLLKASEHPKLWRYAINDL